MRTRLIVAALIAISSVLLIARADDIALVDGKTVFHNAKIISSDAASVTIRHSTGVARVMMLELPPELRAKFQYDPEKARRLLEQERNPMEAANARTAPVAADEPPLMTLDAMVEHQVSLEKSVVDVQFDYRVTIMKEGDPGWFKSVIGIGGRNSAIMDVLVPKDGIAWFESLPPSEKALFPRYVFARVEKDSSGMYFWRLLGTQMLPDGKFDW